jgi:hypothetical protein
VDLLSISIIYLEERSGAESVSETTILYIYSGVHESVYIVCISVCAKPSGKYIPGILYGIY